MNMLINHFIIASRAYSQHAPLYKVSCTSTCMSIEKKENKRIPHARSSSAVRLASSRRAAPRVAGMSRADGYIFAARIFLMSHLLTINGRINYSAVSDSFGSCDC